MEEPFEQTLDVGKFVAAAGIAGVAHTQAGPARTQQSPWGCDRAQALARTGIVVV